MTSLAVGTGTATRLSTFAHDAFDRVSMTTDPLQRTYGLVHDDSNRVVRQRGNDNNETAFSYDPQGNISSVTPPGRPGHVFNYTPVNLESSYAPPALMSVPNSQTSTDYNVSRQATMIRRPDGTSIALSYDAAGRLATVGYPGPDGVGTFISSRTYSAATGQLVGLTTSEGEGLTFGYDGALATSVLATGTVSGTISLAYDNDMRPVAETVFGETVSIAYDTDGKATQIGALGITRNPTNGIVTATSIGNLAQSLQHNSFGELADDETKFGATTLFKEQITRDGTGRIESKTETVAGVVSNYAYAYDSAGRLWQVMKDGVVTATYLYDANGNRTSRVTTSGTDTATTDDQDRLLTHGRFSYTYTANGDLKTKTDTVVGAVTTYAYDGQGALRSVSLPDGKHVEYVIDPQGRRVAKKVDSILGKKWLHSGGTTIAAEIDNSGGVTRLVGGSYFTKDGATYRLIRDHLGSVRMVVDASTGAITQRLDYDEYGKVLVDTNPGFQPLGFAGGHYDAATGLVRFGARDYDAETGRWLSKDPIRFLGGDTNLYAYAASDPINNTDRAGLDIDVADSGAISALARIMANPAIGPLVERLANDPKITVSITPGQLTTQLYSSGGGMTEVYGNDPDASYITYHLPTATCSGGAVGLEDLLAHELGHAYVFHYVTDLPAWFTGITFPVDIANGAGPGHTFAIGVQNAMRPSDNQRPF